MSAVEYVPGGLEIEESKILARLVEEAGADCIHCSQGVYASTHVSFHHLLFQDSICRKCSRDQKVVDIPVIAVGRINDVEIAESVLQADKADLVTRRELLLSRRQIEIINSEKLLEHCTLGMRTSI